MSTVIAVILYILVILLILSCIWLLLSPIISFLSWLGQKLKPKRVTNRKGNDDLEKYFDKVARDPIHAELDVIKGKNSQFEERDESDNLM